MNVYEMLGVVLTIVLILGLSIYSGTKAKAGSAAKNGAGITAGIIMGTLVGGSSTVGTAQLAYTYGMSAWWFTLGGGISCLVLALFFVKPFRRNGAHTLVGMVEHEFGPVAGMSASILNTIGTFINIISQMISASAVLAVLFPSMSLAWELIISTVFMILYVVIGGRKGAGMVGILKLALLYIAMIGSGIMVLRFSGGVGGFVSMVNSIDNPEGVHFFSLLARGAGTDIGAGFSLLLGVLTTQTYAQAVLSAKSEGSARTGALLSTFLIPPIGIGGILVGLYMRANFPGIAAKTALTTFVTTFMPAGLSGVVLGTLFIAVVGTGAGLALGISFVLNEDILNRFTNRFNTPKKQMFMGRMWMILVLALACVLSMGSLGDMILNFAFMSMGLRAAATFAPLCAALFFPGRVNHKMAVASIISGPVAVLVGKLAGLPFDSLFLGIGVGFLFLIIGLFLPRNESNVPQPPRGHQPHHSLIRRNWHGHGNKSASAKPKTM
ncbi:MAG: sodium:solute symporter family protein [Oscillospiraceae bacterium]|nr:sodium:solute symporter family protein [Oscillospiraceae bacterium]